MRCLPRRIFTHWSLWSSLLLIGLVTFLAVFAPLVAPHDPRRLEIGLSNYPPAWYNTLLKVGQPEHLLGTDFLGRDIFSHVIYGARAAMFLALIAMPLTVGLGVLIGVTAGLGHGVIEALFMRLTDIFNSLPAFMFAVILILILRETPTGQVLGGLLTLTLAFALISWVGLARLIYASVLKLKAEPFMEAARSLGASPWHLVFKHILPHLSHLIIVWVVNNIPAIILLEALMGYVGISILQTTDGRSFQDLSWGGLILIGRNQINRNPFMLFAPTLFVLAISMSFSVLGEYLQERLNPQLKSSQIV